MLIFFGTRSAHVRSRFLEYETCPNCGQQGQIRCIVYGKYAHIFWIPIFPVSKSVMARCHHCGHEMNVYSMPAETREAALRFRQSVRMPVWTFVGPMLLAALIGLVAFSQVQIHRQTAAFMADPQVNDYYHIRLSEDGYYSLMRIEAIEGDTVYFALNDYSTSRSSDLDDIDTEANYDVDDLWALPKSDLDLKEVEGLSLDKIRRPQPGGR